ncbi:MAG: TraR/DksA family transcriptional regulator [Desulfobacterales bacterium]|nr:TraR/DksA family transcriptional regulator [Desulfobacterales bacterium]
MKQKVVKRGSRSNKAKVMAIAGAESHKKKRRLCIKSQDFRTRSLENLTAKRQEVEEALSRLAESQKASEGLLSTHDFREEVDLAEREIAAQTHYRLMERKNKELKKIETLIRRIVEDEEFGRCEECGKRIPDERLLIVPEATRCVPCQREMEKWDSRLALIEMTHSFSGRKKEPGWGPNQDSDDEVKISLKTDMEYLSFVELGDADPGETEGENNEK